MLRMFNFKCSHCDYAFERMVQHTDIETHCPVCEKQADKFLGTPSFIVRGGYNPWKVV